MFAKALYLKVCDCGSGAHHFTVFTPASVLELLQYVTPRFNCEVVHIHVGLGKMGDARN